MYPLLIEIIANQIWVTHMDKTAIHLDKVNLLVIQLRKHIHVCIHKHLFRNTQKNSDSDNIFFILSVIHIAKL